MRKLGLAITAAAAVFTAAAVATGASALTLGNSANLLAAGDLAVTEQIHCRPGRTHHEPSRWRRADGCERGGARYDGRPVYRERGPTVVVPVPGVGIRVGPGYGGY